MTQSEYSFWYTIIVFVFCTLSCISINASNSERDSLSPLSPLLGALLSLISVIGITNCPGGYGSDKSRYVEMFEYAESLDFSKDIAWQYFTYYAKVIFSNEWLYFFIIALFYVGCYNFFANKFFAKGYKSYFLILAIGSMGFYAYGMNTLRAGVALGFVLLAFSFRKSILLYLFFFFVAISFHKSMFLPLTIFSLLFFYKNTKTCIVCWGIMLIISFLDINYFSDLVQTELSDMDERVVGYMAAVENPLYSKAGFRWDFIFYSLFPMFIGCYYVLKQGFDDEFYIQILNTYILVNAFWLIVIRIPFTDRFAYLSWFLIPIILIYPLTKFSFFKNQQGLASLMIFVMVFVNFILHVK